MIKSFFISELDKLNINLYQKLKKILRFRWSWQIRNM